MKKDSVYHSSRLTFRGISLDDAEDIVRWRSAPANYKNFFNAKPLTMESHLNWFAKYLEDPSRFDFVILDLDGLLIGTIGLSNITPEECEISYLIGETVARGKGYATEAINALTEVAFSELGVQRVVARILPENEASIRTIKKADYSLQELVYSIKASE